MHCINTFKSKNLDKMHFVYMYFKNNLYVLINEGDDWK